MPFDKIKKLLHESIGLHADTVGESSIDRAISHRMREASCKNPGMYYKLVISNKEELNELIEEVVVPETWFFRNVTPFDVLRENAVKIYARKNKSEIPNDEGMENVKNNPLKVLSVPCSTGEEPYSLAMTINESGLSKEEFSIDAVDISKRALRKARRAIYGKHSFREQGINLQDKYFEKVQSGYRLISALRDCVDFKQANILVDPIGPATEYYDVIFCRNLLIYFDRKTQRTILDKLSSMLKQGGLLFVGHAEAGQIDQNIFTKLPTSKAFAFEKRSKGRLDKMLVSDDQPVNKLKDIYNQLVEVTKKDIALSKKISEPKSYASVKGKKVNYVDDLFEKINKFINAGHLDDASNLCGEYLKKNPESADAYYYLGLISNLQGGLGGAESLLRKAIYLSPNHHKALALSAMLAEKRGDEDGARAFRRREKKARERSS